MRFLKFHGLGNDFILFDGNDPATDLALLREPEIAQALCDRHRGIGADGLLLREPPRSSGAVAAMRVINADGSEPEMCGNGIRCFAKALHDHLGVEQATTLDIDTGAGLRRCELSLDARGAVGSVEVEMGRYSLAPKDLPTTLSAPMLQHPIPLAGVGLDGSTLTWSAVSMGNPHAITFVSDDKLDLRDLALRIGPTMEHHALFPRRTNVEFARMATSGARVDVWVWERGCGITQACGTGACAVAAAAVESGGHPRHEPLQVHLPGGALTIVVGAPDQPVRMNGPAMFCFSGEVNPRALSR